jgi:hypothetical protein
VSLGEQTSVKDEKGLYMPPQEFGGPRGPDRPFSWPARSCLGHVAWSWSVGVVRHVGGEISSEFAPYAFERSPPHLFLYMLLFNKTKVETNKDSAGCKYRGV